MPCSLWLNPQPGPCFSFWVIFLIAVCLGEKAFLLLFITVVSSWTDPIPGIPVLPFPLTSSPRPVLAHHVIFIWMWNYCCRSNTEKLNSSAFFFFLWSKPLWISILPFLNKMAIINPQYFSFTPPFSLLFQFSSVTQSCPTLCNPMNHSTPGLSITNSRSSLKLMSIELVMPSSYLILCRPLLLLPPIPPRSGSFPLSQLFA